MLVADYLNKHRACDVWMFIGTAVNQHNLKLVQNDLVFIVVWSDKSLKPSSLDKRACIHFGYLNPKMSFIINGVTVKTDQCANLGVIKTPDFYYRAHTDVMCLKASRLASIIEQLLITRNFFSTNILDLHLHSAYICLGPIKST